MRIAAPLAAAISLALLAGQPASAVTLPDRAVHLMKPMRPNAQVPAASGPTMLYYGGPVISTVKVEVVFWTAGVAAATKSGIGGFFASIANSTYADQLAQYSTAGHTGVGGHPGTNQTIGRGSLLGQVTIVPKNTATTLTDAAIHRELQHQITTGKLPRQDANTLYMVYFPAGYTITLGSSASCSAFGAYHEASSKTPSATNIFYGVMPDCGGGFATLTVVSSHEFAEAVTDAIPTPGTHPAYPQAWNNSSGYEIGDLCEGTNATLKAGTKSYTVQEVFDNKTNACATGSFTSP